MEHIFGDRKFVEIPGDEKHELPPLLINGGSRGERPDQTLRRAGWMVDQEDLVETCPQDRLVSETELNRRKMDMSINLVEMYLALVRQWNWGDGILEWIRQCEITFGHHPALRGLLRPDVWPHAGRSSFVKLLGDKKVGNDILPIEKAVGLRLTFRQPPPLDVFSDQFLFFLNSTLADTAYQTWASMSPDPVSSLPPERFHVQVVML
jgi:hypothetical protein